MWGKLHSGALVLAVLLLAMPATVSADSKEYSYIYKSTRAMGMGGAYTAVGGRVDSLFYNPAGLINIPQDKGWEVNLINVSAEYGKNTKKFLRDTKDATNTTDLNNSGSADDDKLQAMNTVLADYRGQNLHARIADFTSIGKSYDKWAFGLGGLASGRLDATTHQGFGADGFLEVSADALYGAIGGVSIAVSDSLYAGVGVKSLHRESLIHDFTARELVEHQSDLNSYIKDDLREKGDAYGADLGLIWKFAKTSKLKPAIGVSAMNVGGLHFGQAGVIPMTVNAGFSINPTIAGIRSLIMGVDYVDILNNNKEDKDQPKRLRAGAEVQIVDVMPVEVTLRAGMYEKQPTVGFDLRLLIFTISYAMYTEEVGAYAGQDKDKRQLVTLNIGW